MACFDVAFHLEANAAYLDYSIYVELGSRQLSLVKVVVCCLFQFILFCVELSLDG